MGHLKSISPLARKQFPDPIVIVLVALSGSCPRILVSPLPPVPASGVNWCHGRAVVVYEVAIGLRSLPLSSIDHRVFSVTPSISSLGSGLMPVFSLCSDVYIYCVYSSMLQDN